jgi:soluble lytic murein transglycosylase
VIAALAVLWQVIYTDGILKAEYPERYTQYVEQYAKESGLDPLLVYAVIKSESGFNPDAMSPQGARGLMQLTPETFDWVQTLSVSSEKFVSDDLDKPQVNIKYGTIFLSSLLQEFGGTDTALAAYYEGPNNVKRWLGDGRYSKDGKTLYYIPSDVTRAYVKKVTATEKMYKKLYDNK